MSNPLTKEKQEEIGDFAKKVCETFGETLLRSYTKHMIKFSKAKRKHYEKFGPPKERPVPKTVVGSSFRGPATKKGKIMKNAVQRYLVLQNNSLVYFKDEAHANHGGLPRGTVKISGDHAARESDKDSFRMPSFEIYSKKDPDRPKMKLSVSDEKVCRMWVKKINETCGVLGALAFLNSGGDPQEGLVLETAYSDAVGAILIEFNCNPNRQFGTHKEALKFVILQKVSEMIDGTMEEAIAEMPEMMREKAKLVGEATKRRIVDSVIHPAWLGFDSTLMFAKDSIQKPLEDALDKVFEVEAKMKKQFGVMVRKKLDPLLQQLGEPLGAVLADVVEPLTALYQAFISQVMAIEAMLKGASGNLDALGNKLEEVQKKFFEALDHVRGAVATAMDSVRDVLERHAAEIDTIADTATLVDVVAAMKLALDAMIDFAVTDGISQMVPFIEKLKECHGDKCGESARVIKRKMMEVHHKILGELQVKTIPSKTQICTHLTKAPKEVKDAIVHVVTCTVDTVEAAMEAFEKQILSDLSTHKDETVSSCIQGSLATAAAAAYAHLQTSLSEAVATSFALLTSGMLVPKVASLVISHVHDPIHALRNDVPDALKDYIEPIDLLEEFVVENIEVVVDKVSEPFRKEINKRFAAARAAA
eukprot:Rmarinus@m.26503